MSEERIIKFYRDRELLVSCPVKEGSTHEDRHAMADLLGIGDEWTHLTYEDTTSCFTLLGHYQRTNVDDRPYWVCFDRNGVEIEDLPPPPEEKQVTREEVLDEVIKGMKKLLINYYKPYATSLYSPEAKKTRTDIAEGFCQGIDFVMGLRGVSVEEAEDSKPKYTPEEIKRIMAPVTASCYSPPLTPFLHYPHYGEKTEEEI